MKNTHTVYTSIYICIYCIYIYIYMCVCVCVCVYIYIYIYNLLQAMTALSLELMDITRDWVSSFVMRYQVFTAADFSCCLFVGLSAFSFVFSKWNACSIGLISGYWLCHCRISHFFTFKNSWVAFAVCFGSSSVCTMNRRPINFAPFDWIWSEYPCTL